MHRYSAREQSLLRYLDYYLRTYLTHSNKRQYLRGSDDASIWGFGSGERNKGIDYYAIVKLGLGCTSSQNRMIVDIANKISFIEKTVKAPSSDIDKPGGYKVAEDTVYKIKTLERLLLNCSPYLYEHLGISTVLRQNPPHEVSHLMAIAKMEGDEIGKKRLHMYPGTEFIRQCRGIKLKCSYA